MAAWEGGTDEIREFSCNHKILGEVVADDDQVALQKWRLIHEGVMPCAASG